MDQWIKVGEDLKKAREEKGLTVNEAAEELKIPPWKLRLIEEGSFNRVDVPLYVKGYIKRYAELLGLDGNEMLRQYEEALKSSQHPVVKKLKSRESDKASKLLVVMLSMMAVAVFFFFVSLNQFLNTLEKSSVKLVNTSSESILVDGSEVSASDSVILSKGTKHTVTENTGTCLIKTVGKEWVVRLDSFEVIVWER
ncbi:MAG: helix-turn-helix domain-containing protein [Thermotogaceae bacterium]|nr:helix-turn-helix domain-containing protein [Thermotogaceae bacterium]